ncbi:MAG: D-alanyl-D-alanine carboxypeptidase [Alphaproteobacteria bacterium]|nr:D-alanyl-D-alanine carboxypeptidase [Alphaproteobacteria bacterium]
MPAWRRALFAFVFALAALAAGASSAMPRLLLDMRSGEVLFADEAGQPWHPASLTKLMTAYVTFEAIAAGRLTLDTPVIISERALAEPPAKIGLPVDTALTLENALYLLIVKSANDIAVAIAETVSGSVEDFVFEMNVTASALGMSASHFTNPNGLHDPDQVTTARDLAVLALSIRIRHPQYDALFATESVQLGKARLDSNNNLLTGFAGADGMKTGYVCSSGLNIVATATRQGRDLMAVVLGSASARERGEVAAQLLLSGFSGQISGSGRSVAAIANDGGAPTDMRPLICGKEAGDYVASRAEAYPYGLEGEPSFLSDKVASHVHAVSLLGRLRSVPLPRSRPLWAPEPPPSPTLDFPLPRPRPFLRGTL